MQHTSHSHAKTEHRQKLNLMQNLRNRFLIFIHGTELWASHLPRIPKTLILLALVGVGLGFFLFMKFDSPLVEFSGFALGILLIAPIVIAGRFARRKWKYAAAIRKQVLDAIPWRGDEAVLDVGCGSGLLLNGVAAKLISGKALGIDIWKQHGGGGDLDLLLKNAKAEGVADKIEFKEVDATNMPFENDSFEVIVSSGALHHISSGFAEFERAVKEMTRVLKPGGRIVLWDTAHMIEACALRMESEGGIKSNVQKTEHSPFGFEMCMLVGQKGH